MELFVERRPGGQSPGSRLDDDDDATAVVEICRRLDGIALAIELAAARMVSMSPAEVRDRLDDRFRLLSGPRRGLERHQTLRHAVQWSYDLLDDDERAVLMRCSVFAGGFDLAAASRSCGGDGLDEYAVLDVLDSLVRKSLVTAERVGGHARYGMLETIRQFAEDQLAATGDARRGARPSRPLLRRPGRRPLRRLGRAPPTRRGRLGRCRVRQPARRVPLGRRPGATSSPPRRSPPTPP